MNKINTSWHELKLMDIVIIIAIIVAIIATIVNLKSYKLTIEDYNKEIDSTYVNIITAKTIDFEMEVYNYLYQLNIAHPEIVLIQARIESGNFTSNLFLEYNNMFGMKMPYKRPTMAIGKTSSGFAIYDSWKDSVIDYALYQAYSAKNLSEEAYIDHLNDHYAEDSLYNSKIINYVRTTR